MARDDRGVARRRKPCPTFGSFDRPGGQFVGSFIMSTRLNGEHGFLPGTEFTRFEAPGLWKKTRRSRARSIHGGGQGMRTCAAAARAAVRDGPRSRRGPT